MKVGCHPARNEVQDLLGWGWMGSRELPGEVRVYWVFEMFCKRGGNGSVFRGKMLGEGGVWVLGFFFNLSSSFFWLWIFFFRFCVLFCVGVCVLRVLVLNGGGCGGGVRVLGRGLGGVGGGGAQLVSGVWGGGGEEASQAPQPCAEGESGVGGGLGWGSRASRKRRMLGEEWDGQVPGRFVVGWGR